MTRIYCIALSLILTGCHVGPRVEQMPYLHDPAGAELVVLVEIDEPAFRRERYTGELLEVSANEGLLIAVRHDQITPKLTWFRWNAVHEVDAKRLPKIGRKLWLSGARRSDLIADLMLVARYPQGLSPALRAELLQRYEQPEFEVIEDMERR